VNIPSGKYFFARLKACAAVKDKSNPGQTPFLKISVKKRKRKIT
jgi:hypothetical protein